MEPWNPGTLEPWNHGTLEPWDHHGTCTSTACRSGFARIVSDYTTFASLADVFVVEAFRGRGLSKRLMETIVRHPGLQGLRRWVLATRDAHGLYARSGFEPHASPTRYMERLDPAVFSQPT